MKFEILNNGEWQELQVDSSPQLTDTLDESFDTCQIVLKSNGSQKAMNPDMEIRATEGKTHKRYFVLMSDQVTVASSNPLTYRHTLTLAQNISKWKKFLIRNQVFSQPPSKTVYGKCSMALVKTANGIDSHYEPYVQSVPLDTHMKISRIQCRWGFRITSWTGTKYENYASLGTPKGSIMVVFANGVRVELGRFPDLIQGSVRDEWFDLDMDSFGWKIKNNCHFGAVKLIYEPSYTSTDTDFSNVATDSSHSMALVTFTFEMRCDVYYHTMYDVLSQLRDSCAQYIGEEARKPIPYELPTSGDFYNKLNNTVAPNFTWTQSTLYEALADVFSCYDAVMTLDGSNTIGIEYMGPNGETIDSNAVGYSSSSSSDERVNGMVNYYSRAKRSMTFPDNKGSFMKLRAETLGVPSKGDMSIILPEPIDHLTKVEILIRKFKMYDASSLSGSTSWGSYGTNWQVEGDMVLDVTDRFVEQSVWNNLPKNSVTNIGRRFDTYYQQTTIAYSRGSKSISLSKTFTQNNIEAYFLSFVLSDSMNGLIGIGQDKRYDTLTGHENNTTANSFIKILNPADGKWEEVLVRVEYVALTDGKVRIESSENRINREMITSQGGAECDMDKLADNMMGLIKRTGNETRSQTFEITDWDNVPKKGQSIGKWVVSKVDYRILNDGRYIAIAELSKNFNRLSMRTKIDRAKRFTNVSNDLVQDCEDILTEYVYLSVRSDIETSEISIGSDALKELLGNTFPATVHTNRSIDLAVMEPFDANGNNIIASVNVPMKKYAFGNCICFEMRYDSPMSAGNGMTYDQSGWFGYTSYYSTPILYCDSYGFFDLADIRLMSGNGEWAANLPFVDKTKASLIGAIFDYKYMKKPNERFGLNYEVCFLSDPAEEGGTLIIGSQFMKDNGLMNSNKRDTMKLYYDSDKGFGDGKVDDGKQVSIEVIYTNGKEHEYRIRCSIEQDYVDNWAIADKEGNIYIACNKPQRIDKNDIVFYLTPSKWRL